MFDEVSATLKFCRRPVIEMTQETLIIFIGEWKGTKIHQHQQSLLIPSKIGYARVEIQQIPLLFMVLARESRLSKHSYPRTNL